MWLTLWDINCALQNHESTTNQFGQKMPPTTTMISLSEGLQPSWNSAACNRKAYWSTYCKAEATYFSWKHVSCLWLIPSVAYNTGRLKSCNLYFDYKHVHNWSQLTDISVAIIWVPKRDPFSILYNYKGPYMMSACIAAREIVRTVTTRL